MTDDPTTKQSIRVLASVAAWVTNVLAVAILVACLWQTASLVVDVVRHYSALTIWLLVEAKLPVYLTGGFGSWLLLRRKPGGFAMVCLACLISLTEWAILNPPMIATVLPDFSLGPRELVVSSLCTLTLLVLARLVGGATASRLRNRPWQFSVRSLGAFVALCAVILDCAVSQPRAEAAATAARDQVVAVWQDDGDDAGFATAGRLMSDYPFTSAWINAIYLRGFVLEMREDRQGVRDCYEELLRTAPDDWRKGRSHPFLWAHYSAARWLSDYYEEMGQFELALRYAMLAKNRYKPPVTCLGAVHSEKEKLLARIERLQTKLAADR